MIGFLSVISEPPFHSIGFIRIYGITMAMGIAAATYIAHRRYSHTHNGSTAILDMFLPTVISGIIGARVYHLFTGYDWDSQGISGIIKLRNGGLSIWGAVAVGALAVFIQARIKKISFLELGDAIIPGLLVAQAIGRLGNYFNQELYGRELHAPWALRVDEYYRPLGLENVATYHPTFLYEALWCLILAAVVIFCERKVSGWSRGQTLAFYISLYCAGRTILEWLRIDTATELFGIRFNLLLSAVLCCLGTGWLIYLRISRHKVRVRVDAQ